MLEMRGEGSKLAEDLVFIVQPQEKYCIYYLLSTIH
jgi:hypothetical protein